MSKVTSWSYPTQMFWIKHDWKCKDNSGKSHSRVLEQDFKLQHNRHQGLGTLMERFLLLKVFLDQILSFERRPCKGAFFQNKLLNLPEEGTPADTQRRGNSVSTAINVMLWHQRPMLIWRCQNILCTLGVVLPIDILLKCSDIDELVSYIFIS